MDWRCSFFAPCREVGEEHSTLSCSCTLVEQPPVDFPLSLPLYSVTDSASSQGHEHPHTL